MSDYCIYLKLPSYLRQWFIHRHSGEEPVNLRRGSIESKMLQRATVPLPDITRSSPMNCSRWISHSAMDTSSEIITKKISQKRLQSEPFIISNIVGIFLLEFSEIPFVL